MTRAPGTDHRTLPRRRGAALNSAIFAAVRAEIAESGYAGLTMERVAERARASKASLYRRWPGRAALVLDAAYDAMPDYSSTPDTGSLRGDVLALMRQIVLLLDGVVGEAMIGLLGESLQNPDAAAQIREFGRGNMVRTMREIVGRAVARGECDAGLVTERRLEAGPALLRQRVIFSGLPVSDDYLQEVVDDVVLPLFGVRPEVQPEG
ncbi:TetR/AcrR family transcriptional regulator [Arthrobacter silvisoli]|uniref:TetR/AcrR family transcriptional regulator n=1 Tax=Arthrobacter silvisoli TaxID=2291022 RepID=UPI000E20FB95|nr:TetR/AcrR family transcriptional regulator [Arthrobacter silvisoli]